MKKIEYQAPEMEVIELKLQAALLTISDGSADVTDPDNPVRE